MDYTEAVARSVELLDKNFPGWRKKIDRSKFDISECDSCILSQLFHDYERGLTQFEKR